MTMARTAATCAILVIVQLGFSAAGQSDDYYKYVGADLKQSEKGTADLPNKIKLKNTEKTLQDCEEACNDKDDCMLFVYCTKKQECDFKAWDRKVKGKWKPSTHHDIFQKKRFQSCPTDEGYQEVGGRCLKFHGKTRQASNHAKAIATCAREGAQLALAKTQAELYEMVDAFPDMGPAPAWVGAAGPDADSYTWLDGTPVAGDLWLDGKVHFNGAACASVFPDGKLSDANCQISVLSFFCEIYVRT